MRKLFLLILIFAATKGQCQVYGNMFKEGVRGKVISVETIDYDAYSGKATRKWKSIFEKGGNIVTAISSGQRLDSPVVYAKFSYDKFKKLISFQTGIPKHPLRYVNQYDSFGRLSEQRVYGSSCFKPPVYSFHYNRENQLIKIIKNEKAIDLYPSTQIFIYNRAGKVVKSNEYNFYGVLVHVTMYDYNEFGDAIKITFFDINSDVKVYPRDYRYHYDKKLNWISRKVYDEQSNKYILDQTRKISYQ